MLLFSLAGAFSYSSVTTLSPQHGITGIVLTVCAIMVFCRTLHTQRLPRTALALQILIILLQLSLPPLCAWKVLRTPHSAPDAYTVQSVLPGRYHDQVRVSEGLFQPMYLWYTTASDTPQPGDIILTGNPPVRSEPQSGLLRAGIAGIIAPRRGFVTIYCGPPDMLSAIRNTIDRQIRRLYPAPYSGIVRALLTGTQSEVPKETIAAYRTAGVLHILAASGIHIASVALIPLAFTGFLGCGARFRHAAAALTVLAYLLITDQPASLVRAACMFWTASAAVMLGRHTGALNALLLSAAVILSLCPGDLFNSGFQLSFLAAGGIIILHPVIDSSLQSLPRLLREPLAVSIAAQLPLLPLLYHHFNSVNFNSLPANLLFVPLSTLLLAGSALSLIAGAIPADAAGIPAQVVCRLIHFADNAASLAARLPFSFHPAEGRILLLMLYLGALAVFLAPVHGVVRRLRPLSIVLILILSTVFLSVSEQPKNILYRLPDGAILVKSGAAWHFVPVARDAGVADEILAMAEVHSLTVIVSGSEGLDAAATLLKRYPGSIVLNTRLQPDRTAERLYSVLASDDRLRDNAVDFFPKSDSILSLLMDNMDILMRTRSGSRFIDIGTTRYQLIISGEDTNG